VRIAFVSDVYFPRVNGVSTSIQTFRDSLEALGHEAWLVAPAYPEHAQGVATTDDARLIRVPSRGVPRDPEDRLMRRDGVRALAPRLAAAGIDLVHIHTPFAAHYAGCALAQALRVPVVETYHTYFEEYFHHYLPFVPRGLLKWASRRLSVAQCRDVDALVVPSTPMLEALRAYGVDGRAEVIPTGLQPARFRGADGTRFRAQHGIPAARPVLVHVSRVAHEKNIDFIVRALVRIRAAVPDVLLVIAGEGPAQAHLRRLVDALGLAANVLFIGYLDRSGPLLDCYAAGDAFVFASRTETQGLVLLEALALGVPVVSTAVMGTRDVLAGTHGAVIAPEDEAGYAATVVAVLQDPARRAALAAAAPADAARWSADVMAGRLLALYEALVAAHNPAAAGTAKAPATRQAITAGPTP
jgi:1,2-diacylglycerol 3-alpha-glucosyltransferase